MDLGKEIRVIEVEEDEIAMPPPLEVEPPVRLVEGVEQTT